MPSNNWQPKGLQTLKASDGKDSLYDTVFALRFATIENVHTQLNLNHGFPFIRLSRLRSCIGSMKPLTECQLHSPHGHLAWPGWNRT